MSKTVTLRLKDDIYKLFATLAHEDNRALSNFIETSALRYIQEHEFADEHEMARIRSDQELNKSMKRALRDVKSRRGRAVG